MPSGLAVFEQCLFLFQGELRVTRKTQVTCIQHSGSLQTHRIERCCTWWVSSPLSSLNPVTRADKATWEAEQEQGSKNAVNVSGFPCAAVEPWVSTGSSFLESEFAWLVSTFHSLADSRKILSDIFYLSYLVCPWRNWSLELPSLPFYRCHMIQCCLYILCTLRFFYDFVLYTTEAWQFFSLRWAISVPALVLQWKVGVVFETGSP